MRSKTVLSLVVVAAVAMVQGCSSGESTGKPGKAGKAGKSSTASKAGSTSGIPAAAVAEADSVFSTRCATCHGATGRGDGPGAANLNPKPRDYSDAAWQKTVTDEDIEKTIVYGGAAVGKSPLMVANPDLAGKTDVVKALREKVRAFAQ